jgi:hypothetical protein
MSNRSNTSSPVKWIVGAGLVIALGLMIWFGVLTKAWNGLGNLLFHHQANEMSQDVKDQLAKAAEQKKVLDQTLLDLAKSKEDLAKATKAREDAEKIFDDKSKTATQKLAAYEAAMSAAPIHTDASNVSTEDLCARAKANGSSQATIDALCAR